MPMPSARPSHTPPGGVGLPWIRPLRTFALSVLVVGVAWKALGVSVTHKHTGVDPAYYSAFTIRYREIAALSPGTFLHQRWGYILPSRLLAWAFGENGGYFILRLTLMGGVLATAAAVLRTRGSAAVVLGGSAIVLSPFLWRNALVYYAGAFATLLVAGVLTGLWSDLSDRGLSHPVGTAAAAGPAGTPTAGGRWQQRRFAVLGALSALAVAAHSLSVLILGPGLVAWLILTRRRGRSYLAPLVPFAAVGAMVTLAGRIALRGELGPGVSLWPFAEGGGILGLRTALQSLSYGDLRWVGWSSQLLWLPGLLCAWALHRRHEGGRMGDDPADVLFFSGLGALGLFLGIEFVLTTPVLEHFGYSAQLSAVGLPLAAALAGRALPQGASYRTTGAAIAAAVAVVLATVRLRDHVEMNAAGAAACVALALAIPWAWRPDRRASFRRVASLIALGLPVLLAPAHNPSPSNLWEMEGQYGNTFFDPDRSMWPNLQTARAMLAWLPGDLGSRPDGTIRVIRPDDSSPAVVLAGRSLYPWVCVNDAELLTRDQLDAGTVGGGTEHLRSALDDLEMFQGDEVSITAGRWTASERYGLVIARNRDQLARLLTDVRSLGDHRPEVARQTFGHGTARIVVSLLERPLDSGEPRVESARR